MDPSASERKIGQKSKYCKITHPDNWVDLQISWRGLLHPTLENTRLYDWSNHPYAQTTQQGRAAPDQICAGTRDRGRDEQGDDRGRKKPLSKKDHED